jgi:hypothetical protein
MTQHAPRINQFTYSVIRFTRNALLVSFYAAYLIYCEIISLRIMKSQENFFLLNMQSANMQAIASAIINAY